MRFYLILATIGLTFLSFIPLLGGLLVGAGFLAVVAAIALTLIVDPTKAEMKKDEDSKVRWTTGLGAVFLLFFGHWIIASLMAVLYFVYVARFNVMIQRMKLSGKVENTVEQPLENEVN